MHQLEKKILEEIRKGDSKAFEHLFKSYFAQILSYAKEILKDHHLAEEFAEDTFVKFWTDREKICINTSIRAYLFRCIYNRCINHFKHSKVKNKYRLFFLHHISPDETNSVYSFDFPLARILDKENENLLEESIAKLPKQCREIFILSRYEDLRNDKIAQKLGISVSTVKTQISRALVKLRKDLQEVLSLI